MRKNLQHLRSLGNLLDTKFQGPFGTRFGIDGLLGLIPGGDLVTSALSVYIIAQAAAMGVSTSILIRMAMNVLLENLIDLIPLLGNFFDFYWKANTRNLELIENHMANPVRETIKSRMVVALIAFALLSMLALSGYITFQVIEAFFNWISSLNAD